MGYSPLPELEPVWSLMAMSDPAVSSSLTVYNYTGNYIGLGERKKSTEKYGIQLGFEPRTFQILAGCSCH